MTVAPPESRVAPEMRREENAARQGVMLGVMRRVLVISTALAVLAVGIAYLVR
jgi:hypothetical protein